MHLGARPSVPRSIADPVTSHAVNATGTVEVLEAARRAGGPHVVVASSSSVYGANPALPKREDLVTQPLSPYAASKLATESYALAWQHAYGLPVLAYRFFNVFGPLQPPGHAYAAVVPAFVDAALAGRPLPIYGDGGQTRDFTYVGTVAEVLTRTVRERVTSAEPVNLAFGSRIDLLGLVGLLEELLDRPLAVEHRPARVGDVRDSQADGSKVRAAVPRSGAGRAGRRAAGHHRLDVHDGPLTTQRESSGSTVAGRAPAPARGSDPGQGQSSQLGDALGDVGAVAQLQGGLGVERRNGDVGDEGVGDAHVALARPEQHLVELLARPQAGVDDLDRSGRPGPRVGGPHRRCARRHPCRG